MRTKAEVIVEYWLENKDKILNLNTVAKFIYTTNCASNRAKVKPHVLAAIQQIEEDHKMFIYELRQGKRVLGYKIARTTEEKGLYEINLKKRMDRANYHNGKAVRGQVALAKADLPYSLPNRREAICEQVA